MRTPLHSEHLALGARMVDFHGWDMPVQYAGIIEEHAAVRSRAGLFDLCHMGRLEVTGAGAVPFLDRLATQNVGTLAPGRARYGFLLDDAGGILDDIIVYREAGGCFVVVNAGNRTAVVEWLRARRTPADAIEIRDRSDELAFVAFQGPASPRIAEGLFGAAATALPYYGCARLRTWGADVFIARTGYTGEDGFEIAWPAAKAGEVWRAILEAGRPAGLVPAGLGARDTLRTEAAMPLYGQELTREINPIEAGLGFAVDFGKPDFVGRSALEKVRAAGPARRRFGFRGLGKRIPREGYAVFRDGAPGGKVTSGTYSPTLNGPIGMGYLDGPAAKPGDRIEIDVRGRREPAEVAALPFYRRPKDKRE